MITQLRIALAASLLAMAAPAIAQPDPDAATQVSVKVPYGDLDLTTSSGQAALRHRVRKAALKLCATANDGSAVPEPMTSDCFQQSYRDALRQTQTRIAAAMSSSMVASSGR